MDWWIDFFRVSFIKMPISKWIWPLNEEVRNLILLSKYITNKAHAVGDD